MTTAAPHDLPPDDPAGPTGEAAAFDQTDVPPYRAAITAPPPPPAFWEQPKVAGALGITASIVVHVALIIAGLLLIPPLREAVIGKRQQEQTIVPIAELATKEVGGIVNPGINDDKNRPAGQEVDPTVTQSENWASARSTTLDRNLVSGAGDAVPTVIGVGGNKTGADNKGLGTGVAGGGGLAGFRLPGGGSGIGPRGAVFGNGGNAFRIVFICDGTGTMFDGRKLPLLYRELNTTIAKLTPKQSYGVVFFREGERPVSESVVAVDKTQLLPAIPVNAKKTSDFLAKLTVGGRTKPIPAIELAFQLKPQLVYFLSDGAFDDLDTYDEVVNRFRKLNPDKTVRVNTIIFTNTRESTAALKAAQDTMKKIATENGGTFNPVDPEVVLGQG